MIVNKSNWKISTYNGSTYFHQKQTIHFQVA